MVWGGWKRFALVGVLIVVVLVVFTVLYGWLPWWIDGARLRRLDPKDQVGALGSDRGDVLKMVAGAGALVALVYTARKHALDRKAHALTEQGQVTDRYTKAIAQVASDKSSERIGGIYALERIMADSARDHPTVVEVLAAFVREHAPRPVSPPGEEAAGTAEGVSSLAALKRPDADVQAAMTVLARRPHRDEPFTVDLRRTVLAGLELPPGAHLEQANLSDAELTGANLHHAKLTGAKFRNANLVEAIFLSAALNQADFSGATLTRANLSHAGLDSARFENATLADAYLSYARLSRADLSDATLTRADLQQANLGGANLRRADLAEASFIHTKLSGATLLKARLATARELTAAQLAGTLLDTTTLLDEHLAQDAWVLARIEDCRQWVGGDPVPKPTPAPRGSRQELGS